MPRLLQVVHDTLIADNEACGPAVPKLTFYLDGAHTPESMATCASWFADEVLPAAASRGPPSSATEQPAFEQPERVLLFNCMHVRQHTTCYHLKERHPMHCSIDATSNAIALLQSARPMVCPVSQQ